jgi:hypothetical protein
VLCSADVPSAPATIGNAHPEPDPFESTVALDRPHPLGTDEYGKMSTRSLIPFESSAAFYRPHPLGTDVDRERSSEANPLGATAPLYPRLPGGTDVDRERSSEANPLGATAPLYPRLPGGADVDRKRPCAADRFVLAIGGGCCQNPEHKPFPRSKNFSLRRFKMRLVIGGGKDGQSGCGKLGTSPFALCENPDGERIRARNYARGE